MKIWVFVVLGAMGISALLCAAIQTSAQVPPVPRGQVVLSKLSPPIFPPLARTARVSGDVEIALRIGRDGTVESADVVKGHPLLKEAALNSARQSKFECRECGEAPVLYSVFFTFGYTTNQRCCQPQENSAAPSKSSEPEAGVAQSQNYVTILTEPFCTCDPAADVVKVRSAKCLFLWHCGK